ncbi:MAG: NAD(P)/FAD-dependent oxidoreductase [Microbacteriaceae bacterium]|nr:NAD(P)/FAD-dependent oxidoreductase [Microbacteriaceae bacterium]
MTAELAPEAAQHPFVKQPAAQQFVEQQIVGQPELEQVEVVIIGGGPAGLSAALNLVRARRHVLLVDGNRPRNAATFYSHGFITRDGVPPLELRRLAREELDAYPNYRYQRTMVTAIERTETGFTIMLKGPGIGQSEIHAATIVIASGVAEVMPALPTLRAFYGTSIHSCIECSGWDEQDKPIAVIGETDDLAERATLVSQFSDDIIVFTNGIGQISEPDAAALAARGILIDHRPLADVVGDTTGLTGVVLTTGEIVPRTAAFMRPHYRLMQEYAASLGLAVGADGFLVVDADGRTSAPGVYAAGDSASPGPRQLIVAAGQGARVASALNRDLIGLPQQRP